jgi:hypothetical protein
MRQNHRRASFGFVRGAALAGLLMGCGDQADPDDTNTLPKAGQSAADGAGTSGSSAGNGGGAGTPPGSTGTGSGGRASGSADGTGGATSAGDGGAGSGGAPAVANGADYYPMTDGATWTYRHMGGSTVWDEVVMQSATTYMGKPGVLLEDNPSPSGSRSETVLVSDGSRIARVYQEEFTGATLELTTAYDPGFLRYDRSWEEQSPGYAETAMYVRTEKDAAGTITGESDRAHRFTVEALDDSVTVPAGTFSDCLRVRRNRVRAPGSEMKEGDDDLFWFCPGIGKVREEDQITGQTEELVSCVVPGGACP